MELSVLTCHIRYTIDPYKLAEFEHYAKLWIPLIQRYGGFHLGVFLPHEGANNIAMALFNFASLYDYEKYRQHASEDWECIAANDYAEQTRCILSYERSFYKPLKRE